MNFSTPERVQQTIRAGDEVERVRQDNRVKVTNSANCVPPLKPEEAKRLGIKINVNWGSLLVLLSHARRQYLTAFLGSGQFFKVNMPFAPKETRSEWSAFVTETLGSIMSGSLKYFEHHRSRWASVVTHGVGPMIWYGKDGWCPDFKSMSDLRIATDTTLDFENLGWFASREIYTPFGLIEEVFNEKPNNHWDKKAVARILKNYKEINFVEASQNYDWDNSPEKLAELVKQDGGYYSGDAMPGIPLWHFYFKDEGGWFMRVVPEAGTVRSSATPENFLWESDVAIAERRDQIMQCQFGDLTTDAPFKYHSVRSLGYILLEPEFYDNLTRCRLLQHVHDNFNIWLRTTDPVDKARAQIQEFSNLGVLRTGVTVVPQQERHQIEADLVEMAMAQMKQLKQEASSTYTQQIDTGTKKEQTAFETSVKMQQVNAMLGGLLLTAGKYAKFEYKEECRRFCLAKSDDTDIKKFQRRCKDFGIPRRHLNVDLWEVEPIMPIGAGNPTVAQAAVQQLMQQRMAYEPSAQQAILHEFTQVVTGDARKAAEWAPLGETKDVTGGEEYAQGIFGTLMQGVPVRAPEKINPIEQLNGLIPMFASKIAIIERRDNVGKPDEIVGLQEVNAYMTGLVQRLAADPEQKQLVKKYMDAIGQLMNQVKGLAQRGQEQAKKAAQNNGNGIDPKLMIQAQHAERMSAIKEHATARKSALQEKQKSEQFIREQRRKDAAAHSEIQRQELKAKVEAKNRLKSIGEQ